MELYKVTSRFPKEEVYGITNQLKRCCSSIPANIAEGCGRRTNKDLLRFCYIALGSANETEYFLLLSKDLSYLGTKEYKALNEKINEIRRMLINFIKKLDPK